MTATKTFDVEISQIADNKYEVTLKDKRGNWPNKARGPSVEACIKSLKEFGYEFQD